MSARAALATSLGVLALVTIYLLFHRKLEVPSRASAAQINTPSLQAATTATPKPNLPSAPVPDMAGIPLTIKDKENVGKILTVFGAPIDFYGKVQDQHGNPVGGAKVHYSAADRYFGDSSKYEGTSSSDGLFSITGIKGAGLYVSVYKDDYDGLDQSGGSFGYGMRGERQAPTKDNPAIFILRKKGETEPLVAIDRDIVVAKDGTPIEVSLRTGKVVPGGREGIKMECWADDQHKDGRRRYEWHFRLTIPGGGLIQRQNTSFDFEAPTDGYRPFEEFRMPQSAERWKDSFERDYFVKLGSGTFARMHFRITTGGDHFASITSFLNPQPGSRNLEYDPNKKPPVR